MLIPVKARGLLCGAIAGVTYGLNPLFALPMYGAGMSPEVVLTYRYSSGALIFAIYLLLQKESFALTKKEWLTVILLGINMALSSLTLYMSYTYMDAGVASTILFIYPVLVAAGMAAFFHEKLSFVTIACVVLAFAGVALLSIKEDGTAVSIPGLICALVSALTYAIHIVFVRESPAQNMPPAKFAFYTLTFGVPVFITSFIIYQCCGRPLPMMYPATPAAILCVVMIALVPTMVSYFTTALAIQLVGPTPVAILGALEPLTAVVVGVLVFHEALTANLLFGMVLIIFAVLAIILWRPLRYFYFRHRRHMHGV